MFASFPTFEEFLKNGSLPEIPGIKLPRSITEIEESDIDQKDLDSQIKSYLRKSTSKKAKNFDPNLKI